LKKHPEQPPFFSYLLLVVFLILSVVSLAIQPAYAVQPLNFTYFPEGLGGALSISTFAGGILASVILLSFVVVPVAIIEREGVYGKLISGIAVLGFCVAVSWLPQYFILVIGLIVSLMLAGNARDWMSGGS
jgi:hypothetical protein